MTFKQPKTKVLSIMEEDSEQLSSLEDLVDKESIDQITNEIKFSKS